MRRRVAPPGLGETAATASTGGAKSNKADCDVPLGNASATSINSKRKALTAKQISFLLVMFMGLTGVWLGLRWLFPKHRYHHLLEIPEIKTLLENAPAPIQDNDQYVVFVSNANGHRPYNVAYGRSSISAGQALQQALTQIPLASARYPWFKIDIVTASRVLPDYDSSSKHNDVPSWWYGLSLDWNKKGWVFLPDEVQAHGLVDWKNRLQWDQLGNYVSQRNLQSWPDTVLEDDSTILSQIEILHTNAILVDFAKMDVVPLYHGHRLFEKLTHTLLMQAAERAGDYLARNVHENGKMVYLYRPRSDSETNEYGLTRHAGTVYSMATLYKEYRNENLRMAMKRSLDYMMTFIRDCPLPYDPKHTSKCVWDVDKGAHHVTKLGLNSLTVLAMAEYTHVTHDLDYLDTAKAIATWIGSAQHEDGSFVQKVAEPDNTLDEDYYVRYYQGEATFGLARLYNVVKAMGHEPEEEWMEIADKAATCIVDRDARVPDDDLLVDHWLMYGIAEMGSHDKKHLQHCIRTIEVATKNQVQETSRNQDKDRLGIFGGSTSGTSTAMKTEGMCTVYNLFAEKNPDVAATILETTTYATRFQLQIQFRPETAMYLPDPLRVMGGFHSSLNNYEMRNDYTQHNLSALLCMARLLKEQEVAWNQ